MLQWYKCGAAYKSEKSHLLYMSIYQCITKVSKVKNDTLTLFFQKNIYGQEISILSKP